MKCKDCANALLYEDTSGCLDYAYKKHSGSQHQTFWVQEYEGDCGSFSPRKSMLNGMSLPWHKGELAQGMFWAWCYEREIGEGVEFVKWSDKGEAYVFVDSNGEYRDATQCWKIAKPEATEQAPIEDTCPICGDKSDVAGYLCAACISGIPGEQQVCGPLWEAINKETFQLADWTHLPEIRARIVAGRRKRGECLVCGGEKTKMSVRACGLCGRASYRIFDVIEGIVESHEGWTSENWHEHPKIKDRVSWTAESPYKGERPPYPVTGPANPPKMSIILPPSHLQFRPFGDWAQTEEQRRFHGRPTLDSERTYSAEILMSDDSTLSIPAPAGEGWEQGETLLSNGAHARLDNLRNCVTHDIGKAAWDESVGLTKKELLSTTEWVRYHKPQERYNTTHAPPETPWSDVDTTPFWEKPGYEPPAPDLWLDGHVVGQKA